MPGRWFQTPSTSSRRCGSHCELDQPASRQGTPADTETQSRREGGRSGRRTESMAMVTNRNPRSAQPRGQPRGKDLLGCRRLQRRTAVSSSRNTSQIPTQSLAISWAKLPPGSPSVGAPQRCSISWNIVFKRLPQNGWQLPGCNQTMSGPNESKLGGPLQLSPPAAHLTVLSRWPAAMQERGEI